jgi:hypothetical protein
MHIVKKKISRWEIFGFSRCLFSLQPTGRTSRWGRQKFRTGPHHMVFCSFPATQAMLCSSSVHNECWGSQADGGSPEGPCGSEEQACTPTRKISETFPKCELANKLSTPPSGLLGYNLEAFGNKSVWEKWKSHILCTCTTWKCTSNTLGYIY